MQAGSVPGRTKRHTARRGATPPAAAPGTAAPSAQAGTLGGVVRIGVSADRSGGTAENSGQGSVAAAKLAPQGRSRAQTGKAPFKSQVAPYASMHQRLRAVAATGGVSGEATTKAMKAVPAGRFGRIATVREDGRVLYNLALCGAKSPEESRGAWDDDRPVAQTPAAQAFRSLPTAAAR